MTTTEGPDHWTTTESLRRSARTVRENMYPNRADVLTLCRRAAHAADVIDGLRAEVERLRSVIDESDRSEGGVR